MARKLLFSLFLAGLFIGQVSTSFGLDKAKLGSPVKLIPQFYLPVLAAEEKGFWRDNGLEVEWVPFATAVALIQGVATGDINIGHYGSSGPPAAAERGLPVVMVAELVRSAPFILWVRADSSYRHPRDLKGARIGVAALGATTHVFGQVIAKAHGVEKDVRFVGAGGTPAMMAGLRVGALDAIVSVFSPVAGIKVQGMIRELASAADYVPKPWFEQVVFVRKDYARSKPDLVRKVVKATLQSTDFIRRNPRWAIDKMKSFQGLSEEAAKLVYDHVQFTVTGKLDRKAVENVRNFLIEYGIITEKAPPVDELFTNEYLPQ